jgi:transcriptional regulator with XRE-family HTH domain
MSDKEKTSQVSNPEIIALLGKRFKDYRLALRMTQQEVADKAGLSLVTVRQFESGKSLNITMNSFLALLRTIGQLHDIYQALPEIPLPSLLVETFRKKQPKRIRHKK